MQYLAVAFHDRIPIKLKDSYIIDHLVRPIMARSESLKYVESANAATCWELRRDGVADMEQDNCGWWGWLKGPNCENEIAKMPEGAAQTIRREAMNA